MSNSGKVKCCICHRYRLIDAGWLVFSISTKTESNGKKITHGMDGPSRFRAWFCPNHRSVWQELQDKVAKFAKNEVIVHETKVALSKRGVESSKRGQAGNLRETSK